jgi:hypothetical protein
VRCTNFRPHVDALCEVRSDGVQQIAIPVRHGRSCGNVPNLDRGTGQRQEAELGHVCTRGDLDREFGIQSLGETVKHAKAGDSAASFKSSYG